MQAPINQEVHGRTGLAKVEQYKWLVVGAPGRLVYLPKAMLKVDHKYQRTAKNARVLKLARRWNWLACGVLTVARRGGEHYVVDGQHRLMAAMKRSDIEALPCLVFESSEARAEARVFLDANSERRPVTSYEKWNAQLAAGDENAAYAHSLILASGRVPGDNTTSGTVRCLGALVDAARLYRPELNRVWPLVLEICSGLPLQERVFSALMYLECNLVEGQSLGQKRWRERTVRLGYQGLLEATHRAAAFYARGGAKVWALGVMQELNRNSRVNCLAMRNES